MNVRKIVGLGLTAAVLMLIGAGIARADDNDSRGFDKHSHDRHGYQSTQSPTQGFDAGGSTLDNGRDSFTDAANGRNRPYGADGTESEFGQPDSRFLEGPLGGLADNGPLG